MNVETPETPACKNCGSQRWRTEQLALKTVAGRWLMGDGWLRPDVQVCVECGTRGGILYTYGPGRRGSMMTVAKAALGLLRGPAAPVVYLAALAVALAAALAADRWWGLGWWQVAVAVVAVTWIGSQVGGLVTGITRERFLALRNTLDRSTAGVTAREHRELMRKYRAAPFPIYELDQQWDGQRMLGAHSSDRQRLHSIALTYYRGSLQAKPSVTVTTRPRRSGDPGPECSGADASRDLLRRELIRLGMVDDLGPQAEFSAEHVAVRVDGREAQGLTAEVENERVTVLALGEVVVVVRTNGAAANNLALRRTDNLDPYLRGQREWLDDISDP